MLRPHRSHAKRRRYYSHQQYEHSPRRSYSNLAAEWKSINHGRHAAKRGFFQ